MYVMQKFLVRLKYNFSCITFQQSSKVDLIMWELFIYYVEVKYNVLI